MSWESLALSSDSATMRLISGVNTLDIVEESETNTLRTWTDTANTATAEAPESAPSRTLGTFWFTRSHTWLAKIHALNAASGRAHRRGA